MITYFQAIILGALQGITELFPVSSLGHSILIPSLFKWTMGSTNYFLIFLVATHLATALVLVGFFWSDWVKIVQGIFRSLKKRSIETSDTYAKIGWLLVMGTVPAGILGLLFQEKLQTLLSSPKLVALFLIGNGIVLYGVEKTISKKQSTDHSHNDQRIAKLSFGQSIKIGFAQSIALIPGFSRTGSSLGGGLLSGLDHADAIRFSFLLATPIILAAAVLKLPELIGNSSYAIGPIIVGFIVSGLAAFFSVKFLTRYFKTKTLAPFAMYCIAMGGMLFLIFILR